MRHAHDIPWQDELWRTVPAGTIEDQRGDGTDADPLADRGDDDLEIPSFAGRTSARRGVVWRGGVAADGAPVHFATRHDRRRHADRGFALDEEPGSPTGQGHDVAQEGDDGHFGTKARIGVDTGHGLGHAVEGTAGKISDDAMGDNLPRGGEETAHGDRGDYAKTRTAAAPRDKESAAPRRYVPFNRAKAQEVADEEPMKNR